MTKYHLSLILILFSFTCIATDTIILDIDDSLCFNTKDANLADEIGEKFPNMIQVRDLDAHPGHIYIFLPYVDFLIRYLAAEGFEIYFFSAGTEERNVELLEKYLLSVFTREELEKIQETAVMDLFSREHLESCLETSLTRRKNIINKTRLYKPSLSFLKSQKCKKIRQIFDDRDINDVILIDDYPLNALSYFIEKKKIYYVNIKGGGRLTSNKYFKKSKKSEEYILHEDWTEAPLISTADHPYFLGSLQDASFDVKTHFIYNSVAYYLGVIALARKEEGSLRQGVTKVLFPCGDVTKAITYKPEEIKHNPNRDKCLAVGANILKQMKSDEVGDFSEFNNLVEQVSTL